MGDLNFSTLVPSDDDINFSTLVTSVDVLGLSTLVTSGLSTLVRSVDKSRSSTEDCILET